MSTRGDRVKEGYLKKLPPLSKGPSRRDFKKRWFVLWESCHLAYYRQKDGDAINEINLATCTGVESNYRKDGLTRDGDAALFMSTEERNWLFLADNCDDMQAWADAIERLVRVAKGEPPPVQPRPLDTLPKESTPDQEVRPPARLPVSGINLAHPALSTDTQQIHSQSFHGTDPRSMVNRPLPMVPPNEDLRPALPSSMPHGSGYPMPVQGKSMTLPGRRAPHHDYINTDAQLFTNPASSSQLAPSPFHGVPTPLGRTFTPPASYTREQLERLAQLDENYVSFQREQLAKQQSNSTGYVKMNSPTSPFMSDMHYRPDSRASLQWGPSYGDEPKPVRGYVNLDPSQLPPEPPPRPHGH